MFTPRIICCCFFCFFAVVFCTFDINASLLSLSEQQDLCDYGSNFSWTFGSSLVKVVGNKGGGAETCRDGSTGKKSTLWRGVRKMYQISIQTFFFFEVNLGCGTYLVLSWSYESSWGSSLTPMTLGSGTSGSRTCTHALGRCCSQCSRPGG